MNTKREIVSLHNVIKNYGHGKIITKALREINLKILEGDFLAMMGPSGSGKSTLLNIIGGLDRTTSGEVNFNGKDFNTLSNKDLSIIRRDHIGFVFQNYNLLPVLTAYENAEYVLMLQKVPISQRKEKVMYFFKEMGLDGLEHRFPRELSGGQQQRVAIARAVVSDPLLVLADEITANVDSETAQSLLELMETLNKNNKTTFLFSTHDPAVIKFAKKVIVLKDGKITNEQILPSVRSGGPGADNVGGMAVLIGMPGKEMTVDPGHFMFHQRQYRGSHGASIPDIDFPMYLRLSEEGLFPLDKLVTTSYSLEDAQTAIDDLEHGKIAGRALIEF